MEHVTFEHGLYALAVLGLLMIATAAFRIIRDWGKPYVRMVALGPTRHRVSTSRGKAIVVLVFHADLGSVYAIESNFRGEGQQVTYVPPALATARAHIANRVIALHEGGRSPR